MQQYNEGLSSFENLDPEVGAERRSHRRELLLALLILLGLGLWGGFDWWQGQIGLNNYQAGRQAADQYHWEDARDRFLAASGYSDAAARAVDATSKIATRDREYAAAVVAGGKGDWPAALHALQTVAKVQPDYRDSAARIEEALRHVYTATLRGAVVLRAKAQPPGLYYRAADAWVWLQDSDTASKILNREGSDYFIYDTPGAGFQRRLMLAAVGGDKLSFNTLPLEAARYSGWVWGAAGGWGFASKEPGDCSHLPEQLQVTDGFTCLDIVHSSADGQDLTPVLLPGDAWLVTDVSPDGSHLLLVDATAAAGKDPISALYVAAADGSNPRLLYQHSGWVYQALFSPDGSSALLTMESPAAAPSGFELVARLDTVGQAAPQVLLQTDQDRGGPTIAIEGAFVAGSPGDVLLAERDGRLLTLSLAATGSSGARANVWSGDGPGSSIWLMPADNGRLLLGWFSSIATGSRSFLYMQPGGAAREVLPPLDTREHLLAAWIKGDYLVYLSQQSKNGEANYALRSMPLAAMDDLDAKATLLYAATATIPIAQSGDLSLGPTMLAYLDGEQLNARTYDGATNVVLEDGISAIFNSHFYDKRTSLP